MTISVVDRGIGMDAAEMKMAVTRFGQVASAWSRNHAGTGLGLPLAIGLAELHGGELVLASEKSKGTTATVIFPAERIIATMPTVIAGGRQKRAADGGRR
jgi:signal transduction histidine kinase